MALRDDFLQQMLQAVQFHFANGASPEQIEFLLAGPINQFNTKNPSQAVTIDQVRGGFQQAMNFVGALDQASSGGIRTIQDEFTQGPIPFPQNDSPFRQEADSSKASDLTSDEFRTQQSRLDSQGDSEEFEHASDEFRTQQERLDSQGDSEEFLHDRGALQERQARMERLAREQRLLQRAVINPDGSFNEEGFKLESDKIKDLQGEGKNDRALERLQQLQQLLPGEAQERVRGLVKGFKDLGPGQRVKADIALQTFDQLRSGQAVGPDALAQFTRNAVERNPDASTPEGFPTTHTTGDFTDFAERRARNKKDTGAKPFIDPLLESSLFGQGGLVDRSLGGFQRGDFTTPEISQFFLPSQLAIGNALRPGSGGNPLLDASEGALRMSIGQSLDQSGAKPFNDFLSNTLRLGQPNRFERRIQETLGHKTNPFRDRISQAADRQNTFGTGNPLIGQLQGQLGDTFRGSTGFGFEVNQALGRRGVPGNAATVPFQGGLLDQIGELSQQNFNNPLLNVNLQRALNRNVVREDPFQSLLARLAGTGVDTSDSLTEQRIQNEFGRQIISSPGQDPFTVGISGKLGESFDPSNPLALGIGGKLGESFDPSNPLQQLLQADLLSGPRAFDPNNPLAGQLQQRLGATFDPGNSLTQELAERSRETFQGEAPKLQRRLDTAAENALLNARGNAATAFAGAGRSGSAAEQGVIGREFGREFGQAADEIIAKQTAQDAQNQLTFRQQGLGALDQAAGDVRQGTGQGLQFRGIQDTLFGQGFQDARQGTAQGLQARGIDDARFGQGLQDSRQGQAQGLQFRGIQDALRGQGIQDARQGAAQGLQFRGLQDSLRGQGIQSFQNRDTQKLQEAQQRQGLIGLGSGASQQDIGSQIALRGQTGDLLGLGSGAFGQTQGLKNDLLLGGLQDARQGGNQAITSEANRNQFLSELLGNETNFRGSRNNLLLGGVGDFRSGIGQQLQGQGLQNNLLLGAASDFRTGQGLQNTALQNALVNQLGTNQLQSQLAQIGLTGQNQQTAQNLVFRQQQLGTLQQGLPNIAAARETRRLGDVDLMRLASQQAAQVATQDRLREFEALGRLQSLLMGSSAGGGGLAPSRAQEISGNSGQSAIGAALSGAGIGAQVGGPWGALIGGGLGFAGSKLF